MIPKRTIYLKQYIDCVTCNKINPCETFVENQLQDIMKRWHTNKQTARLILQNNNNLVKDVNKYIKTGVDPFESKPYVLDVHGDFCKISNEWRYFPNKKIFQALIENCRKFFKKNGLIR